MASESFLSYICKVILGSRKRMPRVEGECYGYVDSRKYVQQDHSDQLERSFVSAHPVQVSSMLRKFQCPSDAAPYLRVRREYASVRLPLKGMYQYQQ